VFIVSLIFYFFLNHYFEQYGNGVIVTKVHNNKTLAYSVGLFEGSLIKSISGTNVHSDEDLHKLLKSNLRKSVDIMWVYKKQSMMRSVTLPGASRPNDIILGVDIRTDLSNLPVLSILSIIFNPFIWGITVPTQLIFYLPPILHTIDRKKYLREIDNIFKENRNNREQCIQRLEEKRQEVNELRTNGKINYSDYEVIVNKILNLLDKIRFAASYDKKSLYSLLESIQELVTVYDSTYSLIGVNMRDVFKKTLNFSLGEKESEKNLLLFEAFGGGGRGGYSAIFLFRRHIKKIFSIVLTTCYIYMTNEKDEQQRSILQEIIKTIKDNEQKFIGKKLEKSQIYDLLLRLTPIILTVIASGVITGYLLVIRSSLAQTTGPLLYKFLSEPYLIWLLVTLSYWLVLHLSEKYIINVRSWYYKLIRANEIERKEIIIFDQLIPLQSAFIRNFSPMVSIVYDLSNLAKLKDQGILSEPEFLQMKETLLKK
jgi:hypothetical protein